MTSVFVTVIVSFSLALWLAYLLIRKSGSDLIPPTKLQNLPWGVLDIWVVFSLMLLLQGAGAAIAIQGLPEEASDAAKMERLFYWGGIGRFITLIAAVIYLVIRHRATILELGLNLKNLKLHLIVGTVGFMMIVPMVLLIQFVLVQFVAYEHPTVDALKSNPSTSLIIACILTAVVAAPILEEFVFRIVLQGGIQSWLARAPQDLPKVVFGGRADESESNSEKPDHFLEVATSKAEFRFRTIAPIFASSLIFAGFHIGQGPAPIPLFFLGLGLGYLYYRTQSIIPCWIVHFLLNAWSAGVLLYPQLS